MFQPVEATSPKSPVGIPAPPLRPIDHEPACAAPAANASMLIARTADLSFIFLILHVAFSAPGTSLGTRPQLSGAESGALRVVRAGGPRNRLSPCRAGDSLEQPWTQISRVR